MMAKIMLTQQKQDLVLNGIRWANNILVECLSNYGPALPDSARDSLRDGINKLAEAESEIRRTSNDT